jgi:deazaflavin-dependent oxidoreductase (nitroreductase family)
VPRVNAPTRVERLLNRAFGVLLALGIGLRHNYLLEVRGRTSGRMHATPVNVLTLGGRRFLVAGRGRTQWVRNAEAAGEVTLRKGRRRERCRVRPLSHADKAPVLSAYLDRFRLTVQRYFPVRAGRGADAFTEVVGHYPVFELLPPGSESGVV